MDANIFYSNCSPIAGLIDSQPIGGLIVNQYEEDKNDLNRPCDHEFEMKNTPPFVIYKEALKPSYRN